MRPSGQKAENASTASSVPGHISRTGPHPGGETPSYGRAAQTSEAEKEDSLPRVKLEIPGSNDASLSMSRPRVGSDYLDEAMDTSDFDAKDDRDQESTVSPSDEKAGMTGGDESHRSPSLEMKKKMKRFR